MLVWSDISFCIHNLQQTLAKTYTYLLFSQTGNYCSVLQWVSTLYSMLLLIWCWKTIQKHSVLTSISSYLLWIQVSAKEQGLVHNLETSSEEADSSILSEIFYNKDTVKKEVEIIRKTNGSSDNYTLPLPEQIIELLGKSIIATRWVAITRV